MTASGNFDKQFLDRCKYKKKYFDSSYNIINCPIIEQSNIEELLISYNFDKENAHEIANMLNKCFIYNINKRYSAQELLQDNWFNI